MKYGALIELLQRDGWRQKTQKGSHKQFTHPTKPGKVTVAPHRMSRDVPLGTMRAILQKAGLK